MEALTTMARTAAAPKKKEKADKFAVALQDFAGDSVRVKRGDRFPADHALVLANPSWFVDADLPSNELPTMWDSMPPPPDHRSAAAIRGGPQIPPHRRVESVVNVFMPMPWAKGSDGEKRGVPAPFGGSIVKGQIVDALHPVVAEHPEWFEWPQRHVTLEDVERFSRLEEVDDGEAA
jgi:hypothetical protein